MKVDDIRVFIPTNDYEVSQGFYQALGFKMADVTGELCLFEKGNSTFFLYKQATNEPVQPQILQLSVTDINEAFDVISKLNGFNSRYEPIKNEHWGNVIYLWGPSGELWHVTEFVK